MKMIMITTTTTPRRAAGRLRLPHVLQHPHLRQPLRHRQVQTAIGDAGTSAGDFDGEPNGRSSQCAQRQLLTTGCAATVANECRLLE